MRSVPPSHSGVCAPSLMRLATRLAGRSEDADDLVQATLLRALEHDMPMERGSWLRRVLVNERNMGLRSRLRRQSRESRHAEPPESVDTEDVVHALEVAEIVRTLVGELAPEVREVVEARYFQGHSAAEVARTMGLPAGTVRWRLKRGLDTMRTRLDRRYGGRRALWAGAVLGPQKSPTLPTTTASQGTMSFKTIATLTALLTAGSAGAVMLHPSDDAEVATTNPTRASPPHQPQPQQPTRAASLSRPEHDAHAVWSERRREIHRALGERASDVAEPEPLPPARVAEVTSEITAILGGCAEFMEDSSAALHLTAHVVGVPGEGTIVEEVTMADGSDATSALSECLAESMYTLDLGNPDASIEQDVHLFLGAPRLGDDDPMAEGMRVALEKIGASVEDRAVVMLEADDLEAAAEQLEQRRGDGEVLMVGADGEVGPRRIDELPPEVRAKIEAALSTARSESVANNDAAMQAE